MAKRVTRSYRSTLRQRQAEDTRRRIVDAARKLLAKKGYAGMTVDEIADKAKVAPQTVYAAFGSKRGILKGLLDQTSSAPALDELRQQARAATDPAVRLQFAARIARQIHDAQRDALDLLRGAGVVAPELAALGHDRDSQRYEAQAGTVLYAAEVKRLRPELDVTAARDVFWALTGREIYRLLVVEREWSSDRYEQWLAATLVRTLLA